MRRRRGRARPRTATGPPPPPPAPPPRPPPSRIHSPPCAPPPPSFPSGTRVPTLCAAAPISAGSAWHATSRASALQAWEGRTVARLPLARLGWCHVTLLAAAPTFSPWAFFSCPMGRALLSWTCGGTLGRLPEQVRSRSVCFPRLPVPPTRCSACPPTELTPPGSERPHSAARLRPGSRAPLRRCGSPVPLEWSTCRSREIRRKCASNLAALSEDWGTNLLREDEDRFSPWHVRARCWAPVQLSLCLSLCLEPLSFWASGDVRRVK